MIIELNNTYAEHTALPDTGRENYLTIQAGPDRELIITFQTSETGEELPPQELVPARIHSADTVGEIRAAIRSAGQGSGKTGTTRVIDAITGYGIAVGAHDTYVSLTFAAQHEPEPTLAEFRIPKDTDGQLQEIALTGELRQAQHILEENARRSDLGLNEPSVLMMEDEGPAVIQQGPAGKSGGMSDLLRKMVTAARTNHVPNPPDPGDGGGPLPPQTRSSDFS